MEPPSYESLKAEWVKKYEHDMKILERKRASDRESSKRYREAHREERNQKAREYYQKKKAEKGQAGRNQIDPFDVFDGAREV
jgi:hypothetical protein